MKRIVVWVDREASIGLMLGILVDLPGLNLPLKVIKFFHRQASKEFNPPFYLKGGLQEALVFLLVATLERGRILDAPVGGDRRAGENGRSLAGIVRDRDDEIKVNVREFMPGLAESARGVEMEVFTENLERKRVDFAGRRFASTVDLKAISADGTKEGFGENAAVGVSGAEKEDSESWAHGCKLINRYSALRGALFQSCDKIVTIPPLAFLQLTG